MTDLNSIGRTWKGKDRIEAQPWKWKKPQPLTECLYNYITILTLSITTLLLTFSPRPSHLHFLIPKLNASAFHLFQCPSAAPRTFSIPTPLPIPQILLRTLTSHLLQCPCTQYFLYPCSSPVPQKPYSVLPLSACPTPMRPHPGLNARAKLSALLKYHLPPLDSRILWTFLRLQRIANSYQKNLNLEITSYWVLIKKCPGERLDLEPSFFSNWKSKYFSGELKF